ncbi:hypothetical protein HDU98_003460 [Podochytrium sp. JEL0797]|nr:hypothetical protein HDU98_003460 [Podochytrium sp. JEL0797]
MTPQPTWLSAVDLTSLSRETETEASIQQLCETATRLKTACVCVYPERILQAKRTASLVVATVVSFPLGRDSQAEVVATSARAIADGADELDVVWDYAAYNAGHLETALLPIKWTLSAIESCGSTHTVALKVILETGAIPAQNLRAACDAVLTLFSDPSRLYFLKTSTGKGFDGASVAAATTMLEAIKDAGKMGYVGLKVSGGVRTKDQAEEYSRLAESFGCKHFRIGASSLCDGTRDPSFIPSKRLLHLMARQHLLLPDPLYNTDTQLSKITSETRHALVNHCLHIHSHFNLSPETVSLAFNFLDRYLSTIRVSRRPQLHLLTTTSLFLASKLNDELIEPRILDVSVIASTPEFSIDVKSIKRTEPKILKALNWDLLAVTPHAILSELLTSIPDSNASTNPATNRPPRVSLTTSLRQTITSKSHVFYTLALSDLAFLHYQPATLVLSVLQLIAPNFFNQLELWRVFRFDRSLLEECARKLMEASRRLQRS